MANSMVWGNQERGWRKGPWTPEEDKLLAEYVSLYGEGRWSSVARSSGLNRNGKSCRLRWANYLRPGLKRSRLTPQEEGIIIELHALWGNKWSTIARYLPGRTDNEIKNYWRTHFSKKGKCRAHVRGKKNIQPIQRQENEGQIQENVDKNNALQDLEILSDEFITNDQFLQGGQEITTTFTYQSVNHDDPYFSMTNHDRVTFISDAMAQDTFDSWGHDLWSF